VSEKQLLEAYTGLRDGAVLEVMLVDWPHPSEPVAVWHRFRSWKHGPTAAQLERARQQVLISKKYFFRCRLCLELTNTGHRYGKDVCSGCATQHFGVVY